MSTYIHTFYITNLHTYTYEQHTKKGKEERRVGGWEGLGMCAFVLPAFLPWPVCCSSLVSCCKLFACVDDDDEREVEREREKNKTQKRDKFCDCDWAWMYV